MQRMLIYSLLVSARRLGEPLNLQLTLAVIANNSNDAGLSQRAVV